MIDGTVTKKQLIGFAIEYYHVVHTCPGLLAPAFTHREPRVIRDELQRYFLSELNHDRYLDRPLAAVGIGREELERAIPLPATFGICAVLGALATHHPLSFKSALFIFEDPSAEFDALLKTSCERLGLPREFYGPMLQHSELNDSGDHASITKTLLGDGYVSPADERMAKRNAIFFAEAFAVLEREILDYYGAPSAAIPRLPPAS
jgi:hypothetical protein